VGIVFGLSIMSVGSVDVLVDEVDEETGVPFKKEAAVGGCALDVLPLVLLVSLPPDMKSTRTYILVGIAPMIGYHPSEHELLFSPSRSFPIFKIARPRITSFP